MVEYLPFLLLLAQDVGRLELKNARAEAVRYKGSEADPAGRFERWRWDGGDEGVAVSQRVD